MNEFSTTNPQLNWSLRGDYNDTNSLKDSPYAIFKDNLGQKINDIMLRHGIHVLTIVIDKDTYFCGIPCLHNTDNIELGITYINLIRCAVNFAQYQGLLQDVSSDETYCFAIYHSILHEIGHIVNNAECSNVREQEEKADKFANTIIRECSESNKSAIYGAILSKITELYLDIMMGRNPSKEYEEHPSTLYRINSLLGDVCENYSNVVKPLFSCLFNLLDKARRITSITTIARYDNIVSMLKQDKENDSNTNGLGELDDDDLY